MDIPPRPLPVYPALHLVWDPSSNECQADNNLSITVYTSPSYLCRTSSNLTTSSSSSSGYISPDGLNPTIPSRRSSRPKNNLPPLRSFSRANLSRPPPVPPFRGSSLAVNQIPSTSASASTPRPASSSSSSITSNPAIETTPESLRRSSPVRPVRPKAQTAGPKTVEAPRIHHSNHANTKSAHHTQHSLTSLLSLIDSIERSSLPRLLGVTSSTSFLLPVQSLRRTRSQPELTRHVNLDDSMVLPFKFRLKRSGSARLAKSPEASVHPLGANANDDHQKASWRGISGMAESQSVSQRVSSRFAGSKKGGLSMGRAKGEKVRPGLPVLPEDWLNQPRPTETTRNQQADILGGGGGSPERASRLLPQLDVDAGREVGLHPAIESPDLYVGRVRTSSILDPSMWVAPTVRRSTGSSRPAAAAEPLTSNDLPSELTGDTLSPLRVLAETHVPRPKSKRPESIPSPQSIMNVPVEAHAEVWASTVLQQLTEAREAISEAEIWTWPSPPPRPSRRIVATSTTTMTEDPGLSTSISATTIDGAGPVTPPSLSADEPNAIRCSHSTNAIFPTVKESIDEVDDWPRHVRIPSPTTLRKGLEPSPILYERGIPHYLYAVTINPFNEDTQRTSTPEPVPEPSAEDVARAKARETLIETFDARSRARLSFLTGNNTLPLVINKKHPRGRAAL